jgi:hypothetical protein
VQDHIHRVVLRAGGARFPDVPVPPHLDDRKAAPDDVRDRWQHSSVVATQALETWKRVRAWNCLGSPPGFLLFDTPRRFEKAGGDDLEASRTSILGRIHLGLSTSSRSQRRLV